MRGCRRTDGDRSEHCHGHQEWDELGHRVNCLSVRSGGHRYDADDKRIAGRCSRRIRPLPRRRARRRARARSRLGSVPRTSRARRPGSSRRRTAPGAPSTSRCVIVAGPPQRWQTASSLSTNSATQSSVGIAPNGRPRKSCASPAATTRAPSRDERVDRVDDPVVEELHLVDADRVVARARAGAPRRSTRAVTARIFAPAWETTWPTS